MPMGTYISIIILNVNGLVDQTIWTDQMDTKKKKNTHIYVAYRGPTSALEAHTECK